MKFKKFEMEFFSDSSVIFSIYLKDKVDSSGEVHVHFGKYNVVRITIFVTGEKKIKDTQFIEDLIIELDLELASVFGFLNRGFKIEVVLIVFYNQIRLNYTPFILKEKEIYKALSVQGNHIPHLKCL